MVDYHNEHIKFMNIALSEAKKAAQKAEVPIGAVLVGKNNEILAATHNLTVTLNDPTAHAEILALRQAATKISNYRLPDHVLYVTLEPCVMCVGAMVQARLAKVVYGASDPKGGAIESH